ncbi:MAG: PhaM family polyhydroxyalkanoate granule multifunctional regulatory protein [Betaproteobacteria bacterium]
MAEDSSKELFEYFQKMWNPLSFPIPGMFQPTMSVAEVEKKIAELQSVENWLKMNLTFVQMTVKTLEMQKSALQTIQESAAATAQKDPKKPKDEGRGAKS